jgi:DUF177 domain-containing protein
MKDPSSFIDLQIDVSQALPTVGEKKSVKGAARAIIDEAYDVTFGPGDEVTWVLELRRIAGGVEITGSIDGVVTLSCYRCLEEFEFPLSLKVREHALWLSEEDFQEQDESGLDYLVTEGILDLEPVIRDLICLAFPAKRVCDDSCKGLCVRCGANLNVAPCDCDRAVVDSRLKPLEELKKRLEPGA